MAQFQVLLVVALAVLTAGCTVAAGIFKAGFWTGIILVVVIVVGLMMLLRKRG
jgi:hypothetical protein